MSPAMSDTSQAARIAAVQSAKGQDKYLAALSGVKEICTDYHYKSEAVKWLCVEVVNLAFGIEDPKAGFVTLRDITPQLGVTIEFEGKTCYIDAPDFEEYIPASWSRDDAGRVKVRVGTDRQKDVIRWFKERDVKIPRLPPEAVIEEVVEVTPSPKKDTKSKKAVSSKVGKTKRKTMPIITTGGTMTEATAVRVGVIGLTEGAKIFDGDKILEVTTVNANGTVNARVPGQRGRPRIFKISDLVNNGDTWQTK